MTDCAIQPGILAPVPAHGRYLSFNLRPGTEAFLAQTLKTLAQQADGAAVVVGLGRALVEQLDADIPGLRPFSTPAGSHVEMQHTPSDLWLWLRADSDAGELLHRGRHLIRALAPAFDVDHTLAAFRHLDGRDLTGYEDGTENPEGDKAVSTAAVRGQGAGLDGGSFVAVQQWLHALSRFEAFDGTAQDNMIGRRRADNEELDDAPPSAHVKRTAQESFDPEAFVLRRSMPWAEGSRCGLQFTAFAASLDPFEAQLARMVGAEDGIVDSLFHFSRPIRSACYWCPPVRRNALDLRGINLTD